MSLSIYKEKVPPVVHEDNYKLLLELHTLTQAARSYALLVEYITRKMLNHPGASLSEWRIAFEIPTQTCSYSSSQTTMATLAWAKLHSQTMS